MGVQLLKKYSTPDIHIGPDIKNKTKFIAGAAEVQGSRRQNRNVEKDAHRAYGKELRHRRVWSDAKRQEK